jgi:hypothetical protein
LEDALPQASRALSDERKEYIANLLKNSLTDDSLEHAGKKKLLSLLNELNDPEIILLYYYTVDGKGQERIFALQDRYPFINRTIHLPSHQQPEGEDILFDSYRAKLVFSHLVFGTGGISERATNLGHLLIKYIEPKL